MDVRPCRKPGSLNHHKMDSRKTKQKTGSARRNFIRNSGLTAIGLLIGSQHLSGNSPFLFQDTDVSGDTLIKDALRVAEYAEMKGFIGNRLNLCYQNRILAQNPEHLLEPFRHRTETHLWQSEFWGKWFTSAVLAYRYRPEPPLMDVLQTAVESLIATQTPDGYIGNYKKENRLEEWDIWGTKYCLLGLLDHYDLTGYDNSLIAARKLADNLINEIKKKDNRVVNKGNYRGMAASSVLEPIVRLYSRTNAKVYLDFAEKIVSEWETPEGPQLISKAGTNVADRFPQPRMWYSPQQGQKAYEMMSCYEGLLELYRITGREQYKNAVEKTWENIRDTEINIAGSGASEEMWFGGKQRQTIPVTHFQETCVTVTWIKLSQQLLRLTGDAKYADEIERSYYNALLASLSSDGADWAKYTPLNGQRLPGSGQCGMDLNCCTASGPRGLFTLPLTAVMENEAGFSVNFFVAGSYRLKTPGGKRITIAQQTTYPVSGKITITTSLHEDEPMTLQVRIPAWSKTTRVSVNDEVIKAVVPGSYVKIQRKWSTGDKVEVELDMSGRVHLRGTESKFAAITRGPIVLARDASLGGPPLIAVNRPVTGEDGYIKLNPVPAADGNDLWMQYTAPFVPESYTEKEAAPISIPLCDYASAGKKNGKPAFAVWLPQLYSRRVR